MSISGSFKLKLCFFSQREHLISMIVKLKYESIIANIVPINVIYTSYIYPLLWDAPGF